MTHPVMMNHITSSHIHTIRRSGRERHPGAPKAPMEQDLSLLSFKVHIHRSLSRSQAYNRKPVRIHSRTNTARLFIMRLSLLQALCLLLLFTLYRANPPPTLPLAAFLIGLVWIPLLAILILISPSLATLIREPYNSDRTWSPTGLQICHTAITILFFFWASRDIDVAADINRNLAADFEIFLSAEGEFALFYAAGVSAAACVGLEAGKKASLWFGPLLEWCSIVEWDVEVLERAERC